jgi:dienelactone hydrolase
MGHRLSFGSLVLVALAARVAAQVPANVRAEHRAGQTFVTWGEIAQTGKRYRVYRAEAPITSAAELAGADFLGEVDDRSSRNQGRSLATRAEQTWIVAPGAAPLGASQGLFVHTAEHAADAAYYAVTSVTAGRESTTLVPGSNATTEGLAELPAKPEPVLQAKDSLGELWAHWVGNRDTPFLPALSPWPSHGYNFKYEPGAGPAPRGLVVRLHAAGQTYAQGWPLRFEVPRDVDVLAVSDLQAYTSWSLWFGAHEKLPSTPDASTRVWNYTQQRVLWTLDWLSARLGAAHEPERVYVIGGSMGALGTMYLAGETPERFAAILCRNGLYDLRATDYKNPATIQKLFGSFALDLATRAGLPIALRANAVYMASRDLAEDWPVIRSLGGRNDETVGWMSTVQLYRGLAAAARPAWHYFDERTHNPNGYWKGVQNALLTRTFQTRRDRPSLCFRACSLDDEPGDGQRTSGDPVGTINGYVDYDPTTAAATADGLDFDVYVRAAGTLDDAPSPSAYAALTPRRTAPFVLAPGEHVRFTLREGGTRIEEHLLFADAHGLVHTPPVPLTTTRRQAHFERRAGPGEPTVGEREGNGTPEGATELARGVFGVGRLGAPDEVDHWRVGAVAGEALALELYAWRVDLAGWSVAGAGPLVRVLTPDGASELARHDPQLWPGAARDLELTRFVVPEGGCVIALASDGRGGGAYALRALASAAPNALELELRGEEGINDSPAAAELLAPFATRLAGHGSAGFADWYAFQLLEESWVALELEALRLGLAPGATAYAAATLVLSDGASELPLPPAHLGDAGARLRLAPGSYALGVLPSSDGPYVLAFDARPVLGEGEIEPNDAPGKAQALALGAPVLGMGGAREDGSPDLDRFVFAGEPGARVELEVFDARHAASPFEVELTAPTGERLPLAAELGLARLGALVDAAGPHELLVRASADYTLALTEVLAARPESEPNDELADANPLWAARAAGAIGAAGERDHFVFGARAGRLVRLELHGPRGASDAGGSGHGSAIVPRLTLLDAGGNELVAVSALDVSLPDVAQAAGTLDPRPALALAFAPTVGGTYFVRVEDASGNGGAELRYWLELR